MSQFRHATREATKLRMSIAGPSGSGKTYTALLIACALSDKVAAIDTEHGSVDLYADLFDVDVAPLAAPFHPDRYVELLMDAYESGYETVVVDSLSHAWNGPGGILSLVDDEVARSKSGNSFQAWGKITPLQNRLVQKLLAFPGHLIFTMRSKTEWVQEPDSRGKLVPRKIGLAPVQRDGIDYEVSIAAEMDQTHTLVVTKSRYVDLADAVVGRPGKEFAAAIREQLGKGAAPAASVSGNDKPEEVPGSKPSIEPGKGAGSSGPAPDLGQPASSVRTSEPTQEAMV